MKTFGLRSLICRGRFASWPAPDTPQQPFLPDLKPMARQIDPLKLFYKRGETMPPSLW